MSKKYFSRLMYIKFATLKNLKFLKFSQKKNSEKYLKKNGLRLREEDDRNAISDERKSIIHARLLPRFR